MSAEQYEKESKANERIMLTITREEPHPKAGQRDNGGYGATYPDTQTTTILTVELTEEEWKAVKHSVLEVK